MGYLPADLPRRLDGAGLDVRTLGGWERRGRATLAPRVVVVHDDIIGACPRSVPGIIPNGRSDLPGPLYNLWVECDGTVWVVAGGVSNNAGRGGWGGWTGNSRTVGICRSHHPDGGQRGGTRAQNEAAEVAAEVICAIYRIDASNVVGHKEWTSRKPDPWHLDMAAFRRAVRTTGTTPKPTPTLPPEEDDAVTQLWSVKNKPTRSALVTFDAGAVTAFQVRGRDGIQTRRAFGLRVGGYDLVEVTDADFDVMKDQAQATGGFFGLDGAKKPA